MSFQKHKFLPKQKRQKKIYLDVIEVNRYDGRFGSKIALTISI